MKFRQSITRLFNFKSNVIPLMIGMFIGMALFNADIIGNVVLTIIGGSTYHIAKLTTNGLFGA